MMNLTYLYQVFSCLPKITYHDSGVLRQKESWKLNGNGSLTPLPFSYIQMKSLFLIGDEDLSGRFIAGYREQDRL